MTNVPPEWDAEVAAPDTRPERRGFLRRLIANLRRVFTEAPCHNAPECKGSVRVEKGTRVEGIYCPICRLPGPQPDRRFV